MDVRHRDPNLLGLRITEKGYACWWTLPPPVLHAWEKMTEGRIGPYCWIRLWTEDGLQHVQLVLQSCLPDTRVRSEKVDAWERGSHTGSETARCKWRVGGVFFRWSAPAGPELAEMSQRKLMRQLRLWESPEGPPHAPSILTSPVSPDDQSRGHAGSALFRRLKLNRSIQERRRSSHCICRYSSPRHLYLMCPSFFFKIIMTYLFFFTWK